MKIYLIRHGETDSNKNGIIQGHLDTNLSELGVEQAKKLANRLKDYSFDKIFSSDLKRAADTAKAIQKFHNTKIEFDSRLRERSFGDFSGKKSTEINWDLLGDDIYNRSPKNGESINEHIKRVQKFIDELKSNYLNENILIVSHGGTINAILYILLKINLEDLYSKEKPKNTSVYIIEKKDEGYFLALENCNMHL